MNATSPNEAGNIPSSRQAPERRHAEARRHVRELAGTKLGLAIIATLAVFGIYVIGLVSLTSFARPRLLSTLTAAVEKVVVRVDQPVQSTFVVHNVAMSVEGVPSPACVSGLVLPVQHSTITYSRIGEGKVFIEVAPPDDSEVEIPLEFLPVGSQRAIQPGRGPISFAVPAERPEKDAKPDRLDCPDGEPLVRLPIYGAVSIGEEQKAPVLPGPLDPGLLHSGSLEVSARAIVLGGLMRPTTYPVGTISIPVGARLEAKASSDTAAAFWWGLVGVRKDQPGLHVVTATEAPAFSIYHPGISEPVDVEVGVLVQIFNDPNLMRLQVVIAVFLLVFNLAISVFGIAPWGRRRRTEASDVVGNSPPAEDD